jgi:hypothetical protein
MILQDVRASTRPPGEGRPCFVARDCSASPVAKTSGCSGGRQEDGGADMLADMGSDHVPVDGRDILELHSHGSVRGYSSKRLA